MPVDLTLEMRKAVIAHLRADSRITDLVPAARVFAEQPPAMPDWPFIRYGLPLTGAYEATGWDGSEATIAISVFAKGPGMDSASKISKRLVESMADFQPATFSLADNEWERTQILRDEPDSDGYHAIAEFRVAAVAP